MLVLLMTAVTGAWAQEQSETFTTTAKIVEGTHFTISSNDGYADDDGMCADDGGITVTPKNGETITKVVISCTYYPEEVNDGNTSVSSGTKEITNGGGTITVTGVNASTFTFTCSEGQFGQFVVYYTEAPAAVAVTAHEGATGEYWATYYNSTMSFTADANTTVFQAALSGDQLTLTVVPDREIPADKAVILKSSAATITLTPATTTQTLSGNMLQGTTAEMTGAAGNIYVLNNGTQGVGFYKLKSTGTIGANKAYLTYSSASQARSFFGFDETTGIEMPTAEVIDADAVVYDLQGRRVSQPTKGLYIVNGKKVVIK